MEFEDKLIIILDKMMIIVGVIFTEHGGLRK